MSKVEKVNYDRESLTFSEMKKLNKWAFGTEGKYISDMWLGINKKHFGGKLEPLPLFITNVFPYGGCIGRCFGNYEKRLVHHIELKASLNFQEKLDVLFHEMIHQLLFEESREVDHNTQDWCDEIMRLGKEIWDYDFIASPSNPRKITLEDGTRFSQRIQKEGSITLKQIARFPQSLNLHLNKKDYL